MRGFAPGLRILAVFALATALGVGAARSDPPRRGSSTALYTPEERADPLLPLLLEPVWRGGPAPVTPRPVSTPPSGPGVVAPPAGAPVLPPAGEAVGAAADSAALGADASEKVLVVRCRQLLVSHPVQAARLASLLRAGTSLERAQQAVAGIELTDRTRDYLADDLEPGVRQEVESLPKGGWSEPRPWRGRTLVYQVVSKEMRPRSSVPKLGEGLTPEELDRVARLVPKHIAAPIASADSADYSPAAVLKQEQAVYPANASKPGQVTVVVEVGRVGEVIDAHTTASSDPIFVAPALEAAKRSTYRPAKRDGLPEQGSVTLTFQFAAPNPDRTNPPNH